jgi:hypothetical protein
MPTARVPDILALPSGQFADLQLAVADQPLRVPPAAGATVTAARSNSPSSR